MAAGAKLLLTTVNFLVSPAAHGGTEVKGLLDKRRRQIWREVSSLSIARPRAGHGGRGEGAADRRRRHAPHDGARGGRAGAAAPPQPAPVHRLLRHPRPAILSEFMQRGRRAGRPRARVVTPSCERWKLVEDSCHMRGLGRMLCRSSKPQAQTSGPPVCRRCMVPQECRTCLLLSGMECCVAQKAERSAGAQPVRRAAQGGPAARAARALGGGQRGARHGLPALAPAAHPAQGARAPQAHQACSVTAPRSPSSQASICAGMLRLTGWKPAPQAGGLDPASMPCEEPRGCKLCAGCMCRAGRAARALPLLLRQAGMLLTGARRT